MHPPVRNEEMASSAPAYCVRSIWYTAKPLPEPSSAATCVTLVMPAAVAQVQFTSAPNKLASATAAGITNVTQVAADDGSGKGLAVYQIDLTQ